MIKSSIKNSLFCLACSAFFFANTAIATSTTYTLKGKVTDASNDKIDGVRLVAVPMKQVTHTNANGEFSFTFIRDEEFKVDRKGNFFRVRTQKKGYKVKIVDVKSKDYLTGGKELVIELEPKH